MNAFQRSFIEKSGYDHGWEYVVSATLDEVVLSSSMHPKRVTVRYGSGTDLVLRFSESAVVRELIQIGYSGEAGEAGVLVIPEQTLPEMLQQAARFARSLPNTPLELYRKACEKELSKTTIESTEAEKLVKQRVGQDVFRSSLMDYWDGKCAVTGIGIPELLRASHSKGWAECDNDADRLNVYNGFLLSVHLDALYDQHLMTFDETGRAVFSQRLSLDTLAKLGLHEHGKLSRIESQHEAFLQWHRSKFHLNEKEA